MESNTSNEVPDSKAGWLVYGMYLAGTLVIGAVGYFGWRRYQGGKCKNCGKSRKDCNCI